MEHLRIAIWAATHSKDFKWIEFNSPLRFAWYRGFGQEITFEIKFIWEIESIVWIPYDVQLHYHNYIIKRHTEFDFNEIECKWDDIPF